jgi:hypothetical protein
MTAKTGRFSYLSAQRVTRRSLSNRMTLSSFGPSRALHFLTFFADNSFSRAASESFPFINLEGQRDSFNAEIAEIAETNPN